MLPPFRVTLQMEITPLRNVGRDSRDVLAPYAWIMKMEAAHFSSETSA
jgi:hypothetical protein